VDCTEATIGGQVIGLVTSTGQIVADKRWVETKYIGPVFGSKRTEHHQVWVQPFGANEIFLELGAGFEQLREGHTVTIVSGARVGSRSARYFLLHVHQMNRDFWIVPTKGEILRAMNLPFGINSNETKATFEAVYQARANGVSKFISNG
jgi:hypothetical protein